MIFAELFYRADKAGGYSRSFGSPAILDCGNSIAMEEEITGP
jgi:hypothetical protein